jgi:hypothetical protein
MLNQRLTDAEATPRGDRTDGLRYAGLMVRTILQASSSLAMVDCDISVTAFDAEAEHFAVTDLEAAARALYAFGEMRRRLAGAIADARATHHLSAAIVRAAEALPAVETPPSP